MASGFRNEPIDVSSLPQLDEESFATLHPAYLRVSLMGRAVFGVVALVIGLIVASQLDENQWIPLAVTGAIVAMVVIGMLLRVLEVTHMGFLIRQHDISYRSGVISLATQTVPFVRVQHASINQGPIERAFSLATINVNSAGSNLSIPGVGKDDADRIAALIVERAGELLDDDPSNDDGAVEPSGPVPGL